MAKHDISELYELQGLSLNEKIRRTQARIKQWVDYYGLEHVYVSFSGGKDSTVLLDIARKMYPIKAVYLDTSLEFPELREFVKTYDDVEWLKPKKNFRQVVEQFGYPLISKDFAECVHGAKNYLTRLAKEISLDRPTDRPTDQKEYLRQGGQELLESIITERSVELANLLNERMLKRQGGQNQRLAIMLGWLTKDKNRPIAVNIPSKDYSQFTQERYKFLLYAPFNISNYCCKVFKKNIAHDYNHEHDCHPIIATMATESRLRTQKWLENGCNGFDLREPVSNPMSFWTENDVLMYAKLNNIKLASVYGDIVEDYKKEGQIEGQMSFADLGLFDKVPVYTTTGCFRTGCVACGFGIQCDKRPNRFELIDRVSNPKLRDWIMRGGSFDEDGLWKPDNNGLGYWFVLQYLNVHGNMNIYIPEYERYEREFGNEQTREYLKEE